MTPVAREIMHANPLTVAAEARLLEVQHLLVSAAISGLPVIAREVVWVSPDAELPAVAQVMRDEGIHRVLVGTPDRLEGILTAFDLLRAV
jgi:CBS domain-containing protein